MLFFSFLSGLRLNKSIPTTNVNSYFRVNVRGENLFMHKQTASWYLQEKQQKLSCDRLKRVQLEKNSW